MIKLRINDIKICSANKRLAKTKDGRFFVPKEWTQCKSGLIAKIMENGTNKELDEEKERIYNSENVAIKIEIETYKDLDNCIKIIFDTLEEMKFIKNDRYVTKLFIIKHPIKRGEADNLLITIGSIE